METSNMRKIIIFLLIATLFGCVGEKKKIGDSSEQKYTIVDAKVRKYHKDGTSSYSDYQPFKTRTVDLLTGYEPLQNPLKLSKYGGLMEKKSEATGFFRVEKIDDRWWAIDPEGYYYFNVALNAVRPGKSERNNRMLKERFGTKENWMKETIEMLQKNGFTCAGSWSDADAIMTANKTLEKPFSYCINLNFMSSYGSVRGGIYQQPG
ncbi:MAG: agarase, partial [Draconibacterium sp.]|nr:agarase [Draconibacterium sp.]